ncbi:SDR family NAD(P)-dependent oxidoreductase [Ilumatobacter coccineus]|uniref:Putative oxidoreductase n=1 Tax=Ilumatobacter coccineus (strain NBRC 103263 / KCTC 29153 / YM16-304) TaxID=1313172 RepID=A0A6C7E7E0_ILUCY|nr:SDR family NAD(P)-dependent oxidoreductase [Ilumatobacter coccineus]BAN02401.1 putative oxidoreductase [Ilumatobacter coccineus YM16-304]
MQDFSGKIAVVTGGGTGMGRELAVQLAAAGAHVSMCDLSEENMAEAAALARAAAPASDVRISTHTCDVSDEAAMLVFRDEVLAAHDSDHVNLLFNNAGLSGGGSIFTDTRDSWDRCFNVCFHGVRWGTLAFLDALTKADEGHIVNTSSVNGFWASIGEDRPHTAYSAAKFAVKGFTEALIGDLRVNAPHVKASVVMPGHIGTSIVQNSMKFGARALTDEERELMAVADQMFHDMAPMTAAEAATVILDGVRADRWRILVGDDAHALDAAVRADPERAYDPGFGEMLFAELRSATEGLVADDG